MTDVSKEMDESKNFSVSGTGKLIEQWKKVKKERLYSHLSPEHESNEINHKHVYINFKCYIILKVK